MKTLVVFQLMLLSSLIVLAADEDGETEVELVIKDDADGKLDKLSWT